MAVCYYCNGSARYGGTSVQADGRTCALCSGNGRCQRCTGGVMRAGEAAIWRMTMKAACGMARARAMRTSVAAMALAAGLAIPLTTASGAEAQGCGVGVKTCFVTSQTESLVFNPATVTTTNATNYSTQILGRLNGGTPLYDQTFGVPFNDPIAQAGVTVARAAITTAGGPGVIIGAPVLTASSSNTASTSVTSYALAGTQVTSSTIQPSVQTR